MLIERPCCRRRRSREAPVLLIDELDVADEPFDAFLLEVLAENQITIPELGVVKASAPPITIITSNRTREITMRSSAAAPVPLGRVPDVERELDHRAPQGAGLERLYRQVVEFVQRMHARSIFRRRAWPKPSTGPTRWWR